MNPNLIHLERQRPAGRPLRFLFVHGWRGFSLAEWYLRDILQAACPVPVEFRSLDLPTDGVPINDALPRAVSGWKPDIVGFSCHYWSFREFLDGASWVRHLRPEARIVLGGPQVNSTRAAAQVLERHPAVDYVLRGTAQESLSDLVQAIASRGTETGVPGLSYRDRGLVRHNATDLAPSRRNAPIFCKENHELTLRLAQVREASYETVVGCRARCAYCVYPVSRFDRIDDELVEAELAYLCSFDIPNIRICDAHFAGTRSRAKRLLRHLASVNRRSSIKVYPDTKHVDREYVDLLHEAGAEVTAIGVQTTNPAALEAARRHSVDEGRDAVKLLLEAFPNTPADCIVGLPGDTPETVERTFRDVLDLGFSRVNAFRLHLFPGTSLGDEPESFMDADQLVVTHSGQLLSSAGFPTESLERVASLMHTVHVVAPFVEARRWLAARGRGAALMDLASRLDPAVLFDLSTWMSEPHPSELLYRAPGILGALGEALGPDPELAELLARDLVEVLRASAAERRLASLAWGSEGRHVARVQFRMPDGGVLLWDVGRRDVWSLPGGDRSVVDTGTLSIALGEQSGATSVPAPGREARASC